MNYNKPSLIEMMNSDEYALITGEYHGQREREESERAPNQFTIEGLAKMLEPFIPGEADGARNLEASRLLRETRRTILKGEQ